MEAVILHHETTKKVLEYEKEQFYHYDFRPDAVGWSNGTSDGAARTIKLA